LLIKKKSLGFEKMSSFELIFDWGKNEIILEAKAL